MQVRILYIGSMLFHALPPTTPSHSLSLSIAVLTEKHTFCLDKFQNEVVKKLVEGFSNHKGILLSYCGVFQLLQTFVYNSFCLPDLCIIKRQLKKQQPPGRCSNLVLTQLHARSKSLLHSFHLVLRIGTLDLLSRSTCRWQGIYLCRSLDLRSSWHVSSSLVISGPLYSILSIEQASTDKPKARSTKNGNPPDTSSEDSFMEEEKRRH